MATKDKTPVIDFLRHLPLFSALSDEELTRLIASGHEVSIESGDILMREGEPGAEMYIVLQGEYEVVKEVEGSEVLIARRGAGEVIGEIALLDESPRTATVRALAPSRLLRIDRNAFNELLEWSPSAARAILRTVATRLRDTETMLRQSEKMASLGTLAAGIAHELNNPAAAARRAAKQLASALPEMERAAARLGELKLGDAESRALQEWQDRLARRGQTQAPVDPLEKADRETELLEWLDARAVANSWDMAPRLAEIGFTRTELDEIASQFDAGPIAAVLEWLSAQAESLALLEEIAASTERLSTIVSAVKSYVYLDQAPVQEVDVHAGIENTLVILHYKLKQGITVQREYADDLPRIEAYASELNQVWTNLIDNAIDAMEGHGTITIKTYAKGIAPGEGSGGRVVVEICDDGPPIPVEIQQRIFDPFFTTKPIGKGTGLGLHICYNIVVLRHHGQISVDSQPGATCFRVSLPVSQPASTPNSSATSKGPQP